MMNIFMVVICASAGNSRIPQIVVTHDIRGARRAGDCFAVLE